METIFLSYTTSKIDFLNDKVKEYTDNGYEVVSFKVVGSSEFDKHNQHTIIVVQMNKKTISI